MKVLLQVPNGLKRKVLDIADSMDDDVLISVESYYGACDLRTREAEQLGCDKIVHYGHNKFMTTNFPVEFVEMKENVDVTPILKDNMDVFNGFNSIGLVGSLQFLDSLKSAKEFLE